MPLYKEKKIEYIIYNVSVDTSFLEKINQYVKSIEDGAHYRYFPSKSGLTANGKKLKLGFSCYALKCLFITKKS